jgi:DNA-binding winged helix-turn-helix (wHTH) protein
MIFCFGNCEIDVDRRELRQGGTAVHVQPQVFDLLVYLLDNRGRVVSRDDIIGSVWGDRIVSESTLTSRINAARTAIGDSGEQQNLIRTIARKGFRFVADVQTRARESGSAVGGLVSIGMHKEASRAVDRRSIAVLPFVNMSDDRQQEYFSDGISEDIMSALSKLRWFFVIARNSSFLYKGKSVPSSRWPKNSASLCSRRQRPEIGRPGAHHGAAH